MKRSLKTLALLCGISLSSCVSDTKKRDVEPYTGPRTYKWLDNNSVERSVEMVYVNGHYCVQIPVGGITGWGLK